MKLIMKISNILIIYKEHAHAKNVIA